MLGGGAPEATAGTIRLRGTLGQPIVGGISARDVALEQGFWHGARYHIYLPLVIRNYQP